MIPSCYFIVYTSEGLPVLCDISTLVSETNIITGRNQPILGIDITVPKQTFNSQSYWESVGVDTSDEGLGGNPILVPGSTRFRVETYGGIFDVVYTQTLDDDQGNLILVCYALPYLLKNMNVSDLLGEVHWWTTCQEDTSEGDKLIDEDVLHIRFGDNTNESIYRLYNYGSKRGDLTDYWNTSSASRNNNNPFGNVYNNGGYVMGDLKASGSIFSSNRTYEQTIGKYRVIIPYTYVGNSFIGKTYPSDTFKEGFCTARIQRPVPSGAIFIGNHYTSMYVCASDGWKEAKVMPLSPGITHAQITEKYMALTKISPYKGSIYVGSINDVPSKDVAFIYTGAQWVQFQVKVVTGVQTISLRYKQLVGRDAIGGDIFFDSEIEESAQTTKVYVFGNTWYELVLLDPKDWGIDSPTEYEIITEYLEVVSGDSGMVPSQEQITEAYVNACGNNPVNGSIIIDPAFMDIYKYNGSEWEGPSYDKSILPILERDPSSLPKGWIYLSLVFTYAGATSNKTLIKKHMTKSGLEKYKHQQMLKQIYDPNTGETVFDYDDTTTIGTLSMQVESIIGYTQDIFSFFAQKVGRYQGDNIILDPGMLSLRTIGNTDDGNIIREITSTQGDNEADVRRKGISTDEIKAIQNDTHLWDIQKYGDEIAFIGQGRNCWTALSSYALSTGRFPIFDRHAHLVSHKDTGGFVNSALDSKIIAPNSSAQLNSSSTIASANVYAVQDEDGEHYWINRVELSIPERCVGKACAILLTGIDYGKEYKSSSTVFTEDPQAFKSCAIYLNYIDSPSEKFDNNPLNANKVDYKQHSEAYLNYEFDDQEEICICSKGLEEFSVLFFEFDEERANEKYGLMKIDYSREEDSYCAYVVPFTCTDQKEIKQISLGSDVKSDNQGATYLITKQRVQNGGALSYEVGISDANNEIIQPNIEQPIDAYWAFQGDYRKPSPLLKPGSSRPGALGPTEKLYFTGEFIKYVSNGDTEAMLKCLESGWYSTENVDDYLIETEDLYDQNFVYGVGDQCILQSTDGHFYGYESIAENNVGNYPKEEPSTYQTYEYWKPLFVKQNKACWMLADKSTSAKEMKEQAQYFNQGDIARISQYTYIVCLESGIYSLDTYETYFANTKMEYDGRTIYGRGDICVSKTGNAYYAYISLRNNNVNHWLWEADYWKPLFTEQQPVYLRLADQEYNSYRQYYYEGDFALYSFNEIIQCKVAGNYCQWDVDSDTWIFGTEAAKAYNAQIAPKYVDEYSLRTCVQALVRDAIPSSSFSFMASECVQEFDENEQVVTAYASGIAPEGGDLNLPPAEDYNVDEYSVTSGENLTYMKLFRCLSDSETGKHYWAEVEYPLDGKYIAVGPYKRYFFEYEGGEWREWGTSDEIWRDALFSPRTIIKKAVNVRANQKLYNIPLAYIVLNWPANATKYLFGRPQFEDTEQSLQKLFELQSKAVTNASLSDALSNEETSMSLTAVSIDGQDVSAAIRSGTYSGILISKDNNTGQTTIDGYKNGRRQVRFDSNGSVSCGTAFNKFGYQIGDCVVMDETGFYTRSWVMEDGSEYLPRGYWMNQCTIGIDGKITAAGGFVTLGYDGFSLYNNNKTSKLVKIDQGGLFTYSSENIIQCSIGTDGQITQGQGQVKLDSEGLKTYNSYGEVQCRVTTEGEFVSGGGQVVLDQGGLTTYNSGEEQCSINTDGEIIAGAGQVVLNKDGLTTYDLNHNYQCRVGSNGRIQAAGGLITLGSDGFILKNTTAASGVQFVTIDSAGLKTYNVNAAENVQCSIGTNGKIVAGQGAVSLSDKGIRLFAPDNDQTDARVPFAYFRQSDRSYPFVKMTDGGQVVLGNAVNGWTMVDYSGMKLYGRGEDPSGPGTSREPMVWVDTNGYHMNVAKLQDKSVVYMSKASDNKTTPPGALWEDLGVPSPYDSTIQYAVGDIVQYNIDIFYCKSAVVQGGGNAPPYDQEHWQFVTQFQNEETYDENSLVYVSSADAAEINYGTWANFVDQDDTIRANVNLMSNVNLNAGPVCAVYNGPGDESIYYSVQLSSQGLKTFSYEYDPDTEHQGGYSVNVRQTTQCTVGTNGWITAGQGAVVLNKDGLVTYDTSNNEIQCYVGSNGKITQGAGSIAIDNDGLTTYRVLYKYMRSGGAWVQNGTFPDQSTGGYAEQVFDVPGVTTQGTNNIKYVYFNSDGTTGELDCAINRPPEQKAFDQNTSYSEGQFAIIDGEIGCSLYNGNQGNKPRVLQYIYSRSINYKENDYCVYREDSSPDYYLYRAKESNTTSSPKSSDDWEKGEKVYWYKGDKQFEDKNVEFIEDTKYLICYPHRDGNSESINPLIGVEYHYFLEAFDAGHIYYEANKIRYLFENHNRQCHIGTDGSIIADNDKSYVQIDSDGLYIRGTEVIDGYLNVSRDVKVSGDVKSLGNISATGNLYSTGNVIAVGSGVFDSVTTVNDISQLGRIASYNITKSSWFYGGIESYGNLVTKQMSSLDKLFEANVSNNTVSIKGNLNLNGQLLDFAQGNGYIYACGILIQWGTETVTKSATEQGFGTITFNEEFADTEYTLSLTPVNPSNLSAYNISAQVYNGSIPTQKKVGIQVRSQIWGQGDQLTVHWIAIGKGK